MTATDERTPIWKNRIVGFDRAVDPTQLLAHPLNPRRHPGAQRDALNELLSDVGWVGIVTVNVTTNHVIDGHARIEEAITRGETVPVLYIEISEAEERKVLATLDPIAGMAVYDADVLEPLLDGLDFDGPLQGIIDRISDEATTLPPLDGEDPDPLPRGNDDPGPQSLPSQPICSTEDLWLIGPHRLVIGDAGKLASWELLCAGTKGQMIWTDPPYGVSYQSNMTADEAKALHRRTDGLEVSNDTLDEKGLAGLLEHAFGLAVTHLDPGAAWFTTSPPGPLFVTFAAPLIELGIWHQTIMWLKDRFVLGRGDYHQRYEPMFYGWTPGAAHRGPPDRTQDTVWEFDRPGRSEEHPTMKPVELVERAIRNHTDPGAVILDPFIGSGTTIIAAHQTGRVGYGIELDPGYGDVILRRAQAVTGQVPVLAETGEPHDFLADS